MCLVQEGGGGGGIRGLFRIPESKYHAAEILPVFINFVYGIHSVRFMLEKCYKVKTCNEKKQNLTY